MATVKHTRWDTPHENAEDQTVSPPKTSSDISDGSNSADKKSDRDSPESGCAICLGKLENKSFTDSCFHQFCFTCLLEWSKVKAECPLCKQSFKSIIHNVRSIEDYDQYHLRPGQSPRRNFGDGRRFRYRSTLTAERRRLLAIGDMIMNQVNRPQSMISPWFRHRTAMTSDSRREIYQRGMWVQTVEHQGVQRIRDVTPEFFRQNPACTHRLIPWLNRELVVLLENQESRIAFVMDLVISLIQRYSIQSPEFAIHMRPYTLHRTDHFVHELYHFARSPWDLYTYDQHAIYLENSHVDVTTHSSDSDIIVLSPIVRENNRMEIETNSDPSRFQVSTSSPSSSGISSMSARNLNAQLPNETALQKVKNFLHSLNMESEEAEQHSINSWHTNESKDIINSVPMSPQPGPSGMNNINNDNNSNQFFGYESSNNSTIQNQVVGNTSSDDDCIIIAEGKSNRVRTPVVVDLITSSDSEESSSSRRKRKSSKRLSRRRKYCEDASDNSFSDSSNNDENLPRFKSKIVCPNNLKSSGNGIYLSDRSRSMSNSDKSDKKHGKSSGKVRKHHKKHKKHHRKHKDDNVNKHRCKKHYKGHKSSSARRHAE